MTISPPPEDAPPPGQTDNKDWTWVLDRACPECGADVGSLTINEVAELNRTNAEAWATLLTSDREVAARPALDVWSPLEYGAHVRDVFRLFLIRLELMLDEDDPVFANWDPNVTAEADRYDLQDPATVAAELTDAADRLSERFDSLSAEQLERPGRRSDGAGFSVLSFARYEIHDPLHHLWDVSH